ncbi:MAG: NTE family protein RssA [Bacteroidetes bacterium ADurb.Bin408]|nr:MAG: NTE family protein RssA [Bacteroidetes bacterium ADurb.Bin408]
MATIKKYKNALVLSGGGVRGFAHMGVIKALNEKGIYPDVISGTSAGSIAATLYADGYTPDEVMSFFKAKEFKKFIEIIIPKTGLVKMTGMANLLKKYLRAKTFEELKIPVFITACNMNTGKPEYFSKGELLKPLIASASIPVLFEPVKIGNYLYADGGVMDNFPIKPVEGKTERLIGVFVCPINYQEKIPNLKAIAIRSFNLAVNKNIVLKAPKCDVLIAPKEVDDYGLLEVAKMDKLFEIGYKEALKVLENPDATFKTRFLEE